jgi:hypothetical protein
MVRRSAAFLVVGLIVSSAHTTSAKGRIYRGAWFDVDVPEGFSVHPSLRSRSADGYDSAFFRSPDGEVEFYVFSPLHDGENDDIAFDSATEVEEAPVRREDGITKVTWFTYKAKDGSYLRTYKETREGARWVIGLKYADTATYARYKAVYQRFKKSLRQYAD